MNHKQSFKLLAVLLLISVQSYAVELVSREVPELYKSRIAGQMTDINSVTAKTYSCVNADSYALIVLDEEVDVVEKGKEDSKKFIRGNAIHVAYKALTAGSTEDIGSLHIPFKKGTESVHLIMAQVIQPDGTIDYVEGDGAFIQTSEKNQGNGVYSDEAKVVLVFPNVKKDSIVEYIIYRERKELQIPNEFSTRLYLLNGWPRYLFRYHLSLPEEMGARLRSKAIGTDIESNITRKNSTRTFEWLATDSLEVTYEWERAPTDQYGPSVWLSTLKDWNAFAKWYYQLLEERSTLSPALKSLADNWTKDAKSRKEIVNCLAAKVANDVRYVGLEFGIGGHQPYDCNDVWNKQYGDCKDKANLLRCLLKYKGIKSYLTLVNTDHVGRLVKEIPGADNFTHAIVTIESQDGYLFCDPTIEYLEPGSLGAGSSGREVLLIKPDGFEITRTPDFPNTEYQYNIEAKVNQNGGIEGWLELVGVGYYGASLYSYIRGLQKNSLNDSLSHLPQRFFQSAQTIDVDILKLKETPFVNDYRVKIYFILSAGSLSGDLRLPIPYCGKRMVPSVGNNPTRTTPLLTPIGTTLVKAQIKLPEGWGAKDLPKPLKLKTATADFFGQWQQNAGTLEVEYRKSISQNAVSAASYPQYHNAVNAFTTWSEQSAVVSNNTTAGVTRTSSDAVDMVMMPSSEGQLRLVNEKYPSDINPELRIKALEKILQWFPNDENTCFEVKVFIANVTDKDDKKLRLLETALSGAGPKIDRHNKAWAEYIYGITLQDCGRDLEARKLFERLAMDQTLREFRRGWSFFSLAETYKDESPDKAVEHLCSALTKLSEVLTENSELLLELLIEKDRVSELTRILKTIETKHPANFPIIVEAMLKHAQIVDGSAKQLGMLSEIFSNAASEKAAFRHLLPELESFSARSSDLKEYAKIKSRLKLLIDAHTFEWESQKVDTSLKTPEDFEQAISDADNDHLKYMKLCAEALVRFTPDTATFGELLFKLTNNQVYYYPDKTVTKILSDLFLTLPTTDAYYLEAKFTAAEMWTARKKPEKALNHYKVILKEPKKHADFFPAAVLYAADIYIDQGRIARLPTLFEGIELYENNDRVSRILYKRALLNMQLKRFDAAVKDINFLSRATMSTLIEADATRLIHAGKHPIQLIVFWQHQNSWWKEWIALAKRLGYDPTQNTISFPQVGQFEDFIGELSVPVDAGNKVESARVLDELMQGARWIPELTVQAAEALDWLEDLDKSLEEPIVQLKIKMSSGWFWPDSETALANSLTLVEALYETDEMDACHAEIKKSLKKAMPGVTENQRGLLIMYLVWARSNDKELHKAVGYAEKSVSSWTDSYQQALLVYELSLAYEKMGLLQKKKESLKAAVNDPRLKKQEKYTRYFKQEIKRIEEDGELSRDLTTAVVAWLKTNRPPWYDFVKPASLTDPVINDLEELAMLKYWQKTEVLLPLEKAKLWLLVLLDPKQPMRLKRPALEGLSSVLYYKKTLNSEYRTAMEALFSAPKMPSQFQKELYQKLLWNLARNGVVDHFNELTKNPLYKELSTKQVEDLKEKVEESKWNSMTFDQLKKLYASGDKKRISKDLKLELVGTLSNRALMLGRFEEAKAFQEEDIKLNYDGLSRDRLLKIKLGHIRSIREAKSKYPLIALLRKCANEIPTENTTSKESEEFNAYIASAEYVLTDKEQLSFYTKRIKTWQFSRYNVEALFVAYLESLKSHPVGRSRIKGIIKSMLSDCDDKLRANLIPRIHSWLDMDRDDNRQWAIEALKPYRNKAQNPLSYASIIFVETLVRLRQGSAVDLDLDLDLGPNTSREVAQRVEFVKIENALQARDPERLRRLLATIPESILFDDRIMPDIVKAYQICGLKEEQGLMEESLEIAYHRTLTRSWTAPSQVFRVISLSEAIGDAPKYPRAWVDYYKETIRNKHLRLTFLMRDAEHRHDWKEVSRLGDEFLTTYPSWYDWYYLRARARKELGQTKDAIEDLKIFKKHCKNTAEYPDAMDLLESLEKGSVSPE